MPSKMSDYIIYCSHGQLLGGYVVSVVAAPAQTWCTVSGTVSRYAVTCSSALC